MSKALPNIHTPLVELVLGQQIVVTFIKTKDTSFDVSSHFFDGIFSSEFYQTMTVTIVSSSGGIRNISTMGLVVYESW